ncbi:MAG TPA: polyamine ABC transporter substrate-binding protein [Acetobacteraceae bacterium]|nr:polyamine ABC transporter substrate-binding protein [Acetobacteraceae bacterium]
MNRGHCERSEVIRRWLRSLIGIAVSAVFLLSTPAPAGSQERVLNIYNWTDYIDPAALKQFQKQTGITIHYDVFDSLETLEAKMLAGHSGYDVIVPSSEPTFSRLIKVGALAPIDRTRVPNWKNLDPLLMHEVEASDPGNRYGAIYLWGTTGIGMNPDKVQQLAPAAPTDSWDLLLNPDSAKRLAPCGIAMMDSAIDVIPSVLKYLGKSPNSTDAADLTAVEHTLTGIRRYIRTFASGGAIEMLASGQICLALDYSGDVVQATARAREAGRGVSVRYVAPKEGAQLGFDMLAIPADAAHKEAAFMFINFVLQPDVMAGITNTVRYANAVPGSRPMIRPELLGDTNIFPTPEQMKTFFTVSAVPPAVERQRTRMWARFKAGQ